LSSDSGQPKGAEKAYDKALVAWTKAIEHQPDRRESWYWRGRCHLSRQLRDKALADFSKAIELNQQRDNPGLLSDTWHCRAKTYVELGQFDKGIADFTAAIELMPDNFWHWLLRGQAQAALGQWDKALADYTKAVELNRDERRECREALADAYGNLAFLLRDAGQTAEAEKVAHKAIEAYERLMTDFPSVWNYPSALAVFIHNMPLQQESPAAERQRYERAVLEFGLAAGNVALVMVSKSPPNTNSLPPSGIGGRHSGRGTPGQFRSACVR
jgi:tetratricopeptide (TPR) repeat protein